MRRHVTYANVAATPALLFSMTGGALAAKHYLINSTRQINPKVLKRLKGAKGTAGPRGLTGASGGAGTPGAAGPEGRPGPSSAFSSFHNAAITLESLSGQQTFSSLASVPAGSYWLVATFDAVNGTGATVDLVCELHAGSDVDVKQFRLQPAAGANVNNLSTALQTVHTFAGSGTATVSCNTFGIKPVELEHIRITAVQIGSITNNEV